MEPKIYKQRLEEWLKSGTTYEPPNAYHKHIYEELMEEQQKALTNIIGNPYSTCKEPAVEENRKSAIDAFVLNERDKVEHMKQMAKRHFDAVFDHNPSILMKEFCVVAGGCFVDWFNYTSPKDVDVFVLHNNMAMQLLAEFLEKRGFATKNSEYLKKSNKGAKHVQVIWEGIAGGVQYQFIFTDCKDRKELLSDFDFKHCMTSFHNDKLYITRNIFNAIRDRILVVNNAENIMPWRIEKFTKQRNFTFLAENTGGETLGDILARALNNVKKNSTIDMSHIRTNGPKMVNWRNIKSRPSQEDDDLAWLKIL